MDVPVSVAQELLLQQRDNRLSIRPAENAWGMPKRHRRPPGSTLVPGEWLRWSINYRFGLDDGWLYQLVTWNVAYGVESIGTLFTDQPSRQVEELARLR